MQIRQKAKVLMQGKSLRNKTAIGVDVLGLPHAIMITTADVTDRNGAIDMIDYYYDISYNLSNIKKVLVDGGYTGQNFADEIKKISGAEVEVSLNFKLCK